MKTLLNNTDVLQQYGAICYRRTCEKGQVVLITTRDPSLDHSEGLAHQGSETTSGCGARSLRKSGR
jgi:hypothetical protein